MGLDDLQPELAQQDVTAQRVAVTTQGSAALQENSKLPLAHRLGVNFVLTVLYVVSTLALMHFDTGIIHPFYLPDESQYAVVGQNLVALHTFRFEGQFPLLVPPLYPFIVAAGRLLTGNGSSTLATSLLNHFIMGAVIFPSYALARQLRLTRILAVLVALAAMWVPNMWEADHYMAEVIYYPLFVVSCVAILAYFQRPTARRALLAGAILGLALLAKNTAAALVLAWGLASLAAFLRALHEDRPTFQAMLRGPALRAYLLWPTVGAGLMGCLYGPWLLLRRVSLAACGQQCGGEASVFQQAIKHVGALLSFLPLYASDLFLSVGVLVLPLALLGWYGLTRASWMLQTQALFLGLTVVIVVAMTATFSGFTTQQLRERHMFVLTPLLLALAGCGLVMVRSLPFWKLVPVFALASIGQIALLYSLAFKGPTLVNAPWAYGLGYIATTYRGVTAPLEWDQASFYLGLIVLAGAFQLVWLFKPAVREPLLYVATIVMFIATFLPVLSTLNTLETYDRTDRYAGTGALSKWLINEIGPGKTLLFYGCDPLSPCALQRSPSYKTDVSMYGYGGNHLDLYYAEADGLYEMTPVPDLRKLPVIEASEQADYMLSPVVLTQLPDVGHFGIIQLYDLRGYRASVSHAPRIRVSSSLGCYAEDLKMVQPIYTAQASSTFTATVRVHNISSCVWREQGANRVWLSYRWKTPHGRVIGSFVNAPVSLPHDLTPGQSATVTVSILTPATPGSAILEIDLVTFPGAGSFEEEGAVPIRLPLVIQ